MNNQTLSVRNPERAARILAELIGGEALPLPPLSDCWMVLTGDNDGIELYPDVLNRHGADLSDPFRSNAETYMGAVVTDLPASSVLALARKAGWPARRDRTRQGPNVALSVEGRATLLLACAEDGREDAAGPPPASIRVPSGRLR